MEKIRKAKEVMALAKEYYTSEICLNLIRKFIVDCKGDSASFMEMVNSERAVSFEFLQGHEIEARMEGWEAFIIPHDIDIKDLHPNMQKVLKKGNANTLRIKASAFKRYHIWCLVSRCDVYSKEALDGYLADKTEAPTGKDIVKGHVKKLLKLDPDQHRKPGKESIAKQWLSLPESERQEAARIAIRNIESNPKLQRKAAYKVAIMAMLDGVSMKVIFSTPARQVINEAGISKETKLLYFENEGYNYDPHNKDKPQRSKHIAGTYGLINPEYVLISPATFLKVWKAVRTEKGKNFPYLVQ